MRRITLVMLTLLALMGGRSRAADEETGALGPDAPEAAEKRYAIGRGLYRAGRFADAAAEFAVAFEMMPTSAKLAYNLGRCQERAGQLQSAVDAFQRYLELSPEAQDRGEVEATIAALRRRIEASLRDWSSPAPRRARGSRSTTILRSRSPFPSPPASPRGSTSSASNSTATPTQRTRWRWSPGSPTSPTWSCKPP